MDNIYVTYSGLTSREFKTCNKSFFSLTWAYSGLFKKPKPRVNQRLTWFSVEKRPTINTFRSAGKMQEGARKALLPAFCCVS